MKLSQNEFMEYHKLKRRLAYEQLLNRIGYLALVLSFLSIVFMPSLVTAFIVGALILFSHCMIGGNTKQLLEFSDRVVHSESENLIQAANMNAVKD